MSSHGKKLLEVSSEDQSNRVLRRHGDAIAMCSELLRQHNESQGDQNRSLKSNRARTSVLLNNPGEVFY
jgi:hypothetical protein